jgi:hypothetical protein
MLSRGPSLRGGAGVPPLYWRYIEATMRSLFRWTELCLS